MSSKIYHVCLSLLHYMARDKITENLTTYGNGEIRNSHYYNDSFEWRKCFVKIILNDVPYHDSPYNDGKFDGKFNVITAYYLHGKYSFIGLTKLCPRCWAMDGKIVSSSRGMPFNVSTLIKGLALTTLTIPTKDEILYIPHCIYR